MPEYQRAIDWKTLWPTIQQEATQCAARQPLLEPLYQRCILQHDRFSDALCWILAEQLRDNSADTHAWYELLCTICQQTPSITTAALADLQCQLHSNASIKELFTPLLHFGSYQALQAYRIAHACWQNEEYALASYIQGRMLTQFGVDIHPAAHIGQRIFFDHAVGIVIGETAVIEDDVTLFQGVTLGGTGKQSGNRHPKIRRGAFLGSNAVVLGNIEVGAGAKIAAGSVVVHSVPPQTTVAGQAAKPLPHQPSTARSTS